LLIFGENWGCGWERKGYWVRGDERERRKDGPVFPPYMNMAIFSSGCWAVAALNSQLGKRAA